MGNSIEMLEAVFAGWRLGAIVVPVNFRLVAPEVEYVLADSGARAVIVDGALSPLVDAVRPSLGALDTVVVLGEPSGAVDGGPGVERYDDVLAASRRGRGAQAGLGRQARHQRRGPHRRPADERRGRRRGGGDRLPRADRHAGLLEHARGQRGGRGRRMVPLGRPVPHGRGGLHLRRRPAPRQ
jgi:AMP-binding enzyme